MDAANDNGGTHEAADMHEARAVGDIVKELDVMQTAPAEKFLLAHKDDLYGLLLQGKLAGLSDTIQHGVAPHGITKDKIWPIADMLDDVIGNARSLKEAIDLSTMAMLPHVQNDTQFAEDYATYYILQGLASQRIGIRAAGRIEGFYDFVEEAQQTGGNPEHLKVYALQDNTQSLTQMLMDSGVGKVQAQGFLRAFDAAVDTAIGNFVGAGKSR